MQITRLMQYTAKRFKNLYNMEYYSVTVDESLSSLSITDRIVTGKFESSSFRISSSIPSMRLSTCDIIFRTRLLQQILTSQIHGPVSLSL